MRTWAEQVQNDSPPGEEKADRTAVKPEDEQIMPYLLLCHNVANYEQWKAVFDAHSLTRQTNGSRGGQLFRSSFRLRTVTMGFNLLDSIDSNISTMTKTVTQRLAAELPIFNEAITETLEELSAVVGTDPESILQTRRTTITPIENLTRSAVANGGATEQDVISFASAIDACVRSHLGYPQPGQNAFLGGAGILANRGLSSERETYLNALPVILQNTQVFNPSRSMRRSCTPLPRPFASRSPTRWPGRDCRG